MPAPRCASPQSRSNSWDNGKNLRVRAFLRRETGQSLVEFAMTLPVVLLIVTGICAFGITIAHYMILTDATNVGGRQLAILRNYPNPCSMVTSTIQGAAPTLTPSGNSGLNINFVIEGIPYGNSCNGAGALMKAGDPITVSVTYPCSLVAFGTNFAKVCTLQAQTTELVQ